MQRHLSADLWSGLLFVAAGSGFALIAQQYPYQSAAEMGPGYFPTWLGMGLVVLGAGLIAKALAVETESISSLVARPAVLILTGLLLFGILLERAGLIMSALVLLGIGSFATAGFRLLPLVLFSSALIGLSALLFVYLLGVNIPLWPSVGV